MRALLILGIALLLAGCSLGGGEGGSVKAGELERLVLQPGDVPTVFIRFDEGRQGIADQPGGQSDMNRFGRQGGWKARYRRSGTTETKGPLVIASLVDVFKSTSGAKDEYEAEQAVLGEGEPDWQPVDAPELGDEALAMTFDQGSGQSRVSFFHIAWRDDNAVASLEVNGFGGKVGLADAVALAQKQARRIARAIES